MPVWKFVINKSGSFRGGTEEWANRYHYQRADPWDEAGANAALDELIAAEQTIHSGAVRFTRASAGPPDGATEVFREFSTIVAGEGVNMTPGNLHPEVTVMLEWPVDRRRVLRKFIHPLGGNPGGDRINAPLDAPMSAFCPAIRTLESAVGAGICAPNGDLATGDGGPDVFLRTRQFTAGRKRNLYVLGIKTPLPPGGEIR